MNIDNEDFGSIRDWRERQSLLAKMLRREADPKHQEDVAQVDAALHCRDIAAKRASQWRACSDGGTAQGLELLETRLSEVESESESADADVKRMRGDFLDEPLHEATKSKKLPPLEWERQPSFVAGEWSPLETAIATPEPRIVPVASAKASPLTTAPVAAINGPAPLNAIIHSTKARRDTLTPAIELAQSQCRNPKDTAEVWGALQVLAERKTAPLIGATEDGLQYLKGGAAEIFNRKSLYKRLTRQYPLSTAKVRLDPTTF